MCSLVRLLSIKVGKGAEEERSLKINSHSALTVMLEDSPQIQGKRHRPKKPAVMGSK